MNAEDPVTRDEYAVSLFKYCFLTVREVILTP